jgi:hypothetical protein
MEKTDGSRQQARMARIPTLQAEAHPEFNFVPLKIVQKLVRGFRARAPLDGIDEPEVPQLLSISAFIAMIIQFMKISDFIIGYNVSIRESYPTSTFGLFGPLNNSAILRLNSSKCATFIDLLHVVNDELLVARRHAHYPFSIAANRIDLPRMPVQVSVQIDELAIILRLFERVLFL